MVQIETIRVPQSREEIDIGLVNDARCLLPLLEILAGYQGKHPKAEFVQQIPWQKEGETGVNSRIDADGRAVSRLWTQQILRNQEYSYGRAIAEVQGAQRALIHSNQNPTPESQRGLEILDHIFRSANAQIIHEVRTRVNKNTWGVTREQRLAAEAGELKQGTGRPITWFGEGDDVYGGLKLADYAKAQHEEREKRGGLAAIRAELAESKSVEQEATLGGTPPARVEEMVEQVSEPEPTRGQGRIRALLSKVGRRFSLHKPQGKELTPFQKKRRGILLGLGASGTIAGAVYAFPFLKGLFLRKEVEAMSTELPEPTIIYPPTPMPTNTPDMPPLDIPSDPKEQRPSNEAKNVVEFFLKTVLQDCLTARRAWSEERKAAVKEHLYDQRVNIFISLQDSSEERADPEIMGGKEIDQLWHIKRPPNRGNSDQNLWLSVGLDGSVVLASIPRDIRVPTEYYDTSAGQNHEGDEVLTFAGLSYFKPGATPENPQLYPRERIRDEAERATGLPCDFCMQMSLNGAEEILAALSYEGLRLNIPPNMAFNIKTGDDENNDGISDNVTLNIMYPGRLDQYLQQPWYVQSLLQRIPEDAKGSFFAQHPDFSENQVADLIKREKANSWLLGKPEDKELKFLDNLRTFLRGQPVCFPPKALKYAPAEVMRFCRTRKGEIETYGDASTAGQSAGARENALRFVATELFFNLTDQVLKVRRPNEMNLSDWFKATAYLVTFRGRLDKLMARLIKGLRYTEAPEREQVATLSDLGTAGKYLGDYYRMVQENLLDDNSQTRETKGDLAELAYETIIKPRHSPFSFTEVSLEPGVDIQNCTPDTCIVAAHQRMIHMSPYEADTPEKVLEYWKPLRDKVTKALTEIAAA